MRNTKKRKVYVDFGWEIEALIALALHLKMGRDITDQAAITSVVDEQTVAYLAMGFPNVTGEPEAIERFTNLVRDSVARCVRKYIMTKDHNTQFNQIVRISAINGAILLMTHLCKAYSPHGASNRAAFSELQARFADLEGSDDPINKTLAIYVENLAQYLGQDTGVVIQHIREEIRDRLRTGEGL